MTEPTPAEALVAAENAIRSFDFDANPETQEWVTPLAAAVARAILATAPAAPPHAPQEPPGAVGADAETTHGSSDAHTGVQRFDPLAFCAAVDTALSAADRMRAATDSIRQQLAAPAPGDGLRERIAEALAAAFKTFDPDQTEDAYLSQHLADAVLAARDRHLEQLAEQAAQAEMDRCDAVNRRRDAEAAVRRVRNLHLNDGDSYCTVCTTDYGRLRAPWPCDTIRALEGDVTPKEH